MVKDHSDSERGNLLPPHGVLFPINSKGSFIWTIPTDRITHTTAFVTPVVEHWLEREIAQWVHPMKERSDDPSHHERTLLPRSYISLPSAVVTAEGEMDTCQGTLVFSCHVLMDAHRSRDAEGSVIYL